MAIAELAEIRAREIGGVAAARELAPRAGRRAELVVDHLIHTLPDDEAAVLLLDKAVRLSECEFAAQAYLLDPGLAEDERAPCPLAANEVRYRAVVVERVEGLVEYYDHLAPFVARWEALADAARGGSRDAEPWLVFAEEVSLLEPYARPSGQMYSLSAITSDALIVSAELALARRPPDERLLGRIHAVGERIELHDRNRVRRHIESLQRAYGAR
ncbi:MAG TPA: hypothetical protein VM261_35160 [Kofleriaceae bacterium]|nr:hypothetical protein [Kofleriaceae bacterium]